MGEESICRLIFVKCWIFFAHISYSVVLIVRAPFAQTLGRSTEEGRLDTVVQVWAQSVQCVVRGVRSKFFFRRVWIRRFPGFSFSGVILHQVSSIYFSKNSLCVFAHIYCTCLFEKGMACHNSAFPVQTQVWGTLASMFGRAACRVPCVARVPVCTAILFPL